MTTTLVLPKSMSDELLACARLEVETAAVLLVRPVQGNGGDLRLLAREIRWVPDTAYAARETYALDITSDGYVPALAAAESTGTIPIWMHTHPGDGASPRPSAHDDIVDRQLADLFRLRADCEFYGTLIFAHSDDNLRFSGRLETASRTTLIDRLWCVGERFSLTHNVDHVQRATHERFDRNIRAFGGDVQRVLGDLRVCVVGCGGTGSAVIEQLVRLGVRDFVLIDPDVLSESNITRVYGSTTRDVGRLKVDIAADHITSIAQDARVVRLASMLTAEATARRLGDVDIVFGCTDDNAGRLVLSRAATFLLTPIIDCGVLLSSGSDGRITGIDGRVTVLHPGAACLVCRRRIDLARASAELLPQEELQRLVGEGYAPALAGVEPAVVAYTSMVASAAVGEMLERLVHYGPDRVPSEILLRLHDREFSTNVQMPMPRHYCDASAGKLGVGVTNPFLEQLWTA